MNILRIRERNLPPPPRPKELGLNNFGKTVWLDLRQGPCLESGEHWAASPECSWLPEWLSPPQSVGKESHGLSSPNSSASRCSGREGKEEAVISGNAAEVTM